MVGSDSGEAADSISDSAQAHGAGMSEENRKQKAANDTDATKVAARAWRRRLIRRVMEDSSLFKRHIEL
jgi:hypothetical protein